MDATQFAWIYLILNGEAGGTPGYGGADLKDDLAKNIKEKCGFFDYPQKIRDAYIAKIKEHGVNWYRTRAPQSDIVSMFAGTFCDPENKEFLTGQLVLNNGETQSWCADGVLTSNVFQFMADCAKYEQIAKDMNLIDGGLQ